MTERPILFSAPMVRALLAGTKTQTRRALRAQPPAGTFQVSTFHHPDPRPHFFAWQELPHDTAMIADDWCYPCPYGRPCDRLWVRETWGIDQADNGGDRHWRRFVYRADHGAQPLDNGTPVPWKPSIHMPRSASRITLEITEVRVQRLQEISEEDARAEGVQMPDGTPTPPDWWSYRQEFSHLWESINGPGSWDANPWLWCISFRRTDAS